MGVQVFLLAMEFRLDKESEKVDNVCVVCWVHSSMAYSSAVYMETK